MSKCLDTLEQMAGWEHDTLEVETLAPVRSASVVPGTIIGGFGYLHGLTSVLDPSLNLATIAE
jgi:hypothetical protein